MANSLLPEALVGEFFGVGSVGDSDLRTPVEYVKHLKLPYAFQMTGLREEDMIRQFGALVDGFEDDDDYILDVDLFTFREMLEDDCSLLPDEEHAHSLYRMMDDSQYEFFKTQQTAPATMCFSTLSSDGKRLVSKNMFQFYTALMSRIARGQVEHLSPHCDSIVLCQDDPALGFVIQKIESGEAGDLTVDSIIRATDGIYPANAIPSYHYCDDWRLLERDGTHILWASTPKIAHLDLVSYPPDISSEQTEMLNVFMEKGGGLALGVLPNVDDGYLKSVIDTLKENLKQSLQKFQNSGVSLELLSANSMLSTQCGLSRATPRLSKEIHERSKEYPSVFREILTRFL